MCGIGGIKPSNDDNKVEIELGGVVVHVADFVNCVLSYLGSIADGIEFVVVFVDQVRSELFHDFFGVVVQ